jgi:hypothetical protein
MPNAIRSTVKFGHINRPFTGWMLDPVDTLSELIDVFDYFFYLSNDPTRRVKHIIHVEPYYSLDDVHNDWKLRYDCKTLERDIEVEDMFRSRTNTGDPLYLFVESEINVE